MNDRTIAYFSMEIALDTAMPTYSGGLGVLAGDTIRSAADLKVPMVAVSLPTGRATCRSVSTPAAGSTRNQRNGPSGSFSRNSRSVCK